MSIIFSEYYIHSEVNISFGQYLNELSEINAVGFVSVDNIHNIFSQFLDKPYN